MRRGTKKEAKRNLIIFIIITLLMISAVLVYKYFDDIKDLFNDKSIITDKNNKNNGDNKDNEDNEKIEKEEDPYKDLKNISYYKDENFNRYLTYKEQHPELDYETVVTYVNIGLDYAFYSYINDADLSEDNLLLMNKYFKLPAEYEPGDLETISSDYFIFGNSYVRTMRKEAREHFEQMASDAIANGTPVYGQSAYRPYSMQSQLYDNVVASSGQEYADNDTARPGHSEHQTGLAIDVSSTKSGNMLYFENTDSFTWMQENAHRYGFILRYPNGKTGITGFMYESWHYRYVGETVATDMHNNYPNLTYEEYYYKYLDK